MNSGCRKFGSWSGLALVLILFLSDSLLAQNLHPEPLIVGGEKTALPMRPSEATKSALVHRFWDRENIWLFTGVAVFRNLDYASTYNMLSRGREEILLPDDVVNNHAGFMALESAGTATSIGLSYLLHRTGHHKLERWLSIGHIGVAAFGDARNYALKTKHDD